MNETEWQTSEDPRPMLAVLNSLGIDSTRKLRLVAVAAGVEAGFTHTSHPIARECFAVAEEYADGLVSREKLSLANDTAMLHQSLPSSYGCPIAEAAELITGEQFDQELARAVFGDAAFALSREFEANLIRDIFGNPFRPVAFDAAWRTDTVLSLARHMYESRDFSAMPILADALQDAGCENDDILYHCRGEGPHVRGCWVVDLVLAKE